MSTARVGPLSSALLATCLALSHGRGADAQVRPPSVPPPVTTLPFSTCLLATVGGLPVAALPPVSWRPSTAECEGPSHTNTPQENAIQSAFNNATHADMRAREPELPGLGDLAFGGTVAAPPFTTFRIDPALYSSRLRSVQAASTQGGLIRLIANLGTVLYEGNGNRMDSCAEYVYERFYDSSVIGGALRQSGTNYRAAFNQVYGPTLSPAALGTRSICLNNNQDALFSRDRAFTFGRMFTAPRARNAFKEDRPFVGNDSQFLPDWLREWWEAHTTRDNPDSGVPVSWRWHLDRSNEMRSITRPTPAEVEPAPGHACGGTRAVGYTDEELNYLYDLQARYQQLFGHLKLALPEPATTEPNPLGWVDEIINPDPFNNTLGAQFEILNNGLTTSAFIIAPTDGSPITLPSQVRPLFHPEFLDSLTYQIYVTLQEAERWGCLGPSPTPCDWSPKYFASTLGERYTTQQNDAARECNDRVFNANNFSAQAPNNGVIDNEPGFPTLLTRATRSPHAAQWLDNIAIPCLGDRSNCPGVPSTSNFYAWTGVWDMGDRASTTANMWRPADDATTPYDAFAVRSVNTITQPACTSDTFIGRSRCFDAFVGEATVRRAVGILGNLAPELVQGGRLRLPGRERRYLGNFGNSYFGVDYNFVASYAVTGANNNNRPSSFVNIPSGTGRIGMTSNVGLDSGVTVLGTRYPIAAGELTANLSNGAVVRPFQVGGSLIDVTVTPGGAGVNYTVDASGERSRDLVSASTTVIVLGVPITLSLGATGRIGLGGSATASGPTGGTTAYTAHLANAITPSLSAEGHAAAFANLGIATAGAKGRLTLVSVEIPIAVGVDIGSFNSAQDLRVRSNGSVRLSTLSGRIAAFVEVDLGIWSDSAEAEIISWNGPSVSEEIFRSEYTLPMNLMRIVPWH